MDFSFSEKNEKEESEDSVQVCILVGFDRATQFIRLKKKQQKPIVRQKLNHVHLRRSVMFLLTLRHVDNQDKMIYEPFAYKFFYKESFTT